MAEPSTPSLRKLADITKALPEGEELNKAWEEVLNGTDRTSALLATAWLDLRLEISIQSCFAEQVKQGDMKAFFGSQAPLSSFGAKGDMAFGLGVFGRITLEALKQIGKIRNVFAHAPTVVSFETPEIRIACQKLGLLYKSYSTWEHLKIDESCKGDGSARDSFLDASLIIYLLLLQRQVDVLRLRNDKLARRISDLENNSQESRPNALLGLVTSNDHNLFLHIPYMP